MEPTFYYAQPAPPKKSRAGLITAAVIGGGAVLFTVLSVGILLGATAKEGAIKAEATKAAPVYLSEAETEAWLDELIVLTCHAYETGSTRSELFALYDERDEIRNYGTAEFLDVVLASC